MNNNQFNNTSGQKSSPSNNGMNSGAVKSDKDSLTHRAGDAIERVGEQITKAGAEKLGKIVHDAGNKIEHMDKKS